MTSVDKMLPQTIQTLFPTTSMADVRGMPITYTSDGQVKNYHYDMLWDFASTETGKIGNSHIVSFTPTNAMYRKDIQDVLYHLHGWT